jgi:hypothetical protein
MILEAEESGDADALRSVGGGGITPGGGARQTKGDRDQLRPDFCILWRGRPAVAVPRCSGLHFMQAQVACHGGVGLWDDLGITHSKVAVVLGSFRMHSDDMTSHIVFSFAHCILPHILRCCPSYTLPVPVPVLFFSLHAPVPLRWLSPRLSVP